MLAFIIRRILVAIPVLFIVAFITFFLMHAAPGGPFDRENKQISPATLAALKASYGLDKPEYVNPAAFNKAWQDGERNPLELSRAYLDSQFFNYVFGAVQGKLGPSYRERGKQVEDILAEHWPYSIRLGVLALLLAVGLGIPLGIISALRQNTWLDYVSVFFATFGVSIPTFITGILVIVIFGSMLKWISISTNDWGTWRPYIAPGIVLGLATMSFITRITRATILEVKRQDYIRTARAKGLAESTIITRHMLRNALIPVVTLLGPALVDLITGALITEGIFGVPGIGRYFVQSIATRDYSMIMGSALMYATLIVLANICVDLSYGFLDPRIRSTG